MGYQYPYRDVDENLKLAVWAKGTPIAGYDAATWRRDCCGAAMQYSAHGNTVSVYGWEIDHIKAKANGGSDSLTNLHPLQWENDRKKGDN